ncbi:extracellular calcium-sensing receptor-like [Exaiptasia diaphana]|uniref:G-protein coupled receptors family 3 profile domain-containing protein n=1 Tax=Exaiptasia diaphana TaxID=2652724 RepID=A0A913X4K7_EXADI|nr:extracellular calcium-sensing receptor-like [Exaiptasia diaphana]
MLLTMVVLVGFIKTTTQYSLTLEGDLTIGGLFPMHLQQPQSCSCDPLSTSQCRRYTKGIFLAESMVYAVELVNKQAILPFNVSLGYNISDTCSSLGVSLSSALTYASLRKSQWFHQDNRTFTQEKRRTLLGVIGAGKSELSLAVNYILSLYDIPQVAYASSATFLNDKSRYKTFLRVLPPDGLQAKAIAQLIAHFKWNYISMVSTDDHYSGALRQAFKEEARRLDICLSNDVVFSNTLPPTDDIQNELEKIKQTKNSSVILLFATETKAEEIIKVADAQNLTSRIWIASDSWSNAKRIIQQRLSVLKGSVGIMFSYHRADGFREYLRGKLRKSTEILDKNSWLQVLTDVLRTEGLDSALQSQDAQSEKILRTAFAQIDYVMNSVYLLSHAIREFCLDLKFLSNTTATEKKQKCLETIYPKVLLGYLFNKTIRGFSRNFSIDENGDPAECQYDFYNIQDNNGEPNYVKIGQYDSKSMLLDLNDSIVDFGNGFGRIPASQCSEVCPAGYFVIRESIQCCWECKPCQNNEISNVSMATSCVACDDDYAANENKSRCVYVPLQYFSWTHPSAIVLGLITIFGFLLTVFILAVFIRHRKSPVVRASCFEITIALLVSIAMGFLLPIIQLSKPSSSLCKASAFLFAIIFTLILSLTLAKIYRTVLILNNRYSTKLYQARCLRSSRAHFITVAVLTAIQVSICMAWFHDQPPLDKITKTLSLNPSRYLWCTNNTSYWFLISSGFLILLSVLCTILAFKSRNFPENYNHAKFVSLAMFTFDMVWLSLMAAYYGSTERGVKQHVIHICAVIFSNFLLLLFIFAPKVYVIFFRPELNNARTFREMNFQHILQGAAEQSRTFSLASLQGHGNVYMMSSGDENNKAVQTPRTYTRDQQIQVDFKHQLVVHKRSLGHRILGIGARKRHMVEKRAYSESDACDPPEIPGKYFRSSSKRSNDSNDANGLRMIEEGTPLAITAPSTEPTPRQETHLMTEHLDAENNDDIFDIEATKN